MIAPTPLDLAIHAHDLTDSYEPTEQDLDVCLVCGGEVTLDTYRDEDRHHGGYVYVVEVGCQCDGCDSREGFDEPDQEHVARALRHRAIVAVALESDRRSAAERAETVRPGEAA